nr:hypothetical protein [Actinoalloteichus caeruleus]
MRRALDATTSDGTGRVLLVVDQAEELFTQANAVDRARFLDALAALTEAHDGGGGAPVLAVVGLRADHVRRCVDHPLLLTALERTTLAVEPMRPAELARSVLGPAEAVGLRVEPGLVDLLLADLGTAHRSGEPGTLPHLGHALRETWRRREGNTLTVAGYRDAGGVSGAISGAAESCYQRLSPDQRRLVRRLFTELVTVSGDAEPHRRRRGRAELVEAWEPSGSWDPEVLDGLVEARLVTVGEDSVEISHEVLPRSWDRLRAWLAEDREELVLRGRLSVAARDWDGGGRPPDSLWRGTQLAVVRAWVGERPRSRLPGRRLRGRRSTEDSSPPSPVGLPPVEADFVRASVRLDRRRDRARVGVVVGLVALLVAALTGAGVAVVQLRTSTVLAAEALSRQYAAQAALDEATQQRRAQLGALAAWRASPTVEARSALFSQVLNPLRGPLTGQGAAVSDVAVTDDGTVAATADGGGEVVLWNVADRTERTRLRVTDSGVYRVVLSPDGDQVVTTDLDPGGGLAAWDAAGGNPRWRGGPGTSELAYRPSGDLLASADADNVVRLRDPATGQVVDEATAHEDLVTGMAFSMDGSRLATGDLVGEIVVRDLPGSRELVRVRPTGAAISGVSLNEDGTRLVTTSLDGMVRYWDVDTGLELFARDNSEDPATAVSHLPGDGIVVTGHVSGRLRVTVVGSWESNVLGTARGVGGVRALASSPSTGAVVWAGGTGDAVVHDHQGTVLLGHEGAAGCVDFDPTGTTLATTAGDARVRVWDHATGRRTGAVDLGPSARPHCVAVAPGGRRLATGGTDRALRLWELDSGEQLAEITLPLEESTAGPAHTPGEPAVLRFRPDGRAVHTALAQFEVAEPDEAEPGVLTWYPDTGALRAHDVRGTTGALDLHPWGTLLAVGRLDGTIALLESGTGERRGDLGEAAVSQSGVVGTSLVSTLRFSPDGTLLAATRADDRVSVWDWGRGELVHELATSAGARATAFSPDGSLLAVGGVDAVIRLWRTDTWEPYAVLDRHDAAVNDLAFSPDGRTLASTSDDGRVLLWPTSVDQATERLCSTVVDAQFGSDWRRWFPDLDDTPC